MNPQSVKCLALPHVSCGAGALIKGCFAPVLGEKGRQHKALGPISAHQLCYMCMPMRPNKADETVVLRRWEYCKITKIINAETAVQLGSCLGDMAVRMPDRSKKVTFLVDRVKCVSIPIIKTG